MSSEHKIYLLMRFFYFFGDMLLLNHAAAYSNYHTWMYDKIVCVTSQTSFPQSHIHKIRLFEALLFHIWLSPYTGKYPAARMRASIVCLFTGAQFCA